MDTTTLPATTDPLHDPRRPVLADCERALQTQPDCEVCDDTGEILDAPGRGGRAVLPCLNCDAYDLRLHIDADLINDYWEDHQ